MPLIEDDERYAQTGAVPPIKFKDADTIVDPTGKYKKGIRIEGYDAPETAKIKGGIFTPGQIGGYETQKVVEDIQQKGGFNEVRTTGKKDNYKRDIGDLYNSEGKSLSSYLVDTGVVPVTGFTKDAQVRSKLNAQASLDILKGAQQGSLGYQAAQMIQDANNKAAVDQGYLTKDGPRFLPKTEAFNEVDYGQNKAVLSHKNRGEIMEDIEYLQGKLDKAKTDKERERIRGELSMKQLGLQDTTLRPDDAGGPMTRLGNRTIDNKSINQLSDSWDTGMANIRKGFNGIGAMAGDKTGWEWLKTEADAQNYREKLNDKNAPLTLSSYKDVDSVGNAFQYVGNLLASSAPQMIIQIAGNALTGGLGTVLSGAVYAGEAYNEQPEDKKNAALALGTGAFAAAVDQLGVEALLSKGSKFSGNLANKADRTYLAELAMKTGKYNSKEAAEKAINELAQREVLSFASNAKQMVNQQMTAKARTSEFIKELGTTMTGEAVGEVVQEALSAWGATGNFNPIQAAENMSYMDWKQFEDSLKEAAAGGALAGGTIGGVVNTRKLLKDLTQRNLKEDFAKDLSTTVQYNAQNRERLQSGDHDGFYDVADAAKKFAALDVTGRLPENSLGNSYDLDTLEGKDAGKVSTRLKEVMKDPWSVFRGAAGTAIRSTHTKNETPRVILPAIMSMISGSGHLQGAHYSRDMREMTGAWQGQSVDQLAAVMKSDVGTAKALVKDALGKLKKGESLDGPQYLEVKQFIQQQEDIRAAMKDTADSLQISVPHLESFETFMNGIGGEQVKKIQKGIPMIRQAYADRDNIFKSHLGTALKNVSSTDKGKASAARTWLNENGVTNNPDLESIFENDPLEAFAAAKNDLAYQAAQKKYWGKNGETIGKALAYAWSKGEFDSEQEFRETAHMLNKMHKISTGEYHNMDDWPKMKSAYNVLTTATLLNVLTKTAITSQIETMISSLGHSGPAFDKQMATYVKEIGGGFKSDVSAAASALGFKQAARYIRPVANADTLYTLNELQKERSDMYTTPERVSEIDKEMEELFKENFNHTILEHLGYKMADGAAGRYNDDPSGINHQKLVQRFVRGIQLKNVTEAQRLGVISVVPDIFMDQLSCLLEIPNLEMSIANPKLLTKEQAQALNQLTEVGMDVPGMLSYLRESQAKGPEAFQEFMLSPDENLKELQKTTLSAIGNYVDKHIVEPDFTNSPVFYHSPWLRPLTTLKRFTATANAVIIPRLYNEYILKGNLDMKYEAFQTMALAVMMAHLTNLAKDVVTYGSADDDELEKRNRKMTKGQMAARDIYSSGLLGPLNALPYLSAQSFYDPFRQGTAHGAVGNKLKSGDILGAAGQIATDVSPMASWAGGALSAIPMIANDQTEKAFKKVASSAPIIGGSRVTSTRPVEALAQYFKKD